MDAGASVIRRRFHRFRDKEKTRKIIINVLTGFPYESRFFLSQGEKYTKIKIKQFPSLSFFMKSKNEMGNEKQRETE